MRYQSAMSQFNRKLTLLNILAAVCEKLGPSCIKNAHHTIDFVKVDDLMSFICAVKPYLTAFFAYRRPCEQLLFSCLKQSVYLLTVLKTPTIEQKAKCVIGTAYSCQNLKKLLQICHQNFTFHRRNFL